MSLPQLFPQPQIGIIAEDLESMKIDQDLIWKFSCSQVDPQSSLDLG